MRGRVLYVRATEEGVTYQSQSVGRRDEVAGVQCMLMKPGTACGAGRAGYARGERVPQRGHIDQLSCVAARYIQHKTHFHRHCAAADDDHDAATA